MTAEVSDVMERVAHATRTTLILSGAPVPHRDLDTALSPGELFKYELMLVERNLLSRMLEKGIATFVGDGTLERKVVLASIDNCDPITFRGDSGGCALYVRVTKLQSTRG